MNPKDFFWALAPSSILLKPLKDLGIAGIAYKWWAEKTWKVSPPKWPNLTPRFAIFWGEDILVTKESIKIPTYFDKLNL